MNKEELIGQIIDIFENNLTKRDVSKYSFEAKPEAAIIPLYFEDEDSDGVLFGGEHYNKVALLIEETLKNWGLLPVSPSENRR